MIGEAIHGLWKAWRAVKDAPTSAAIARARLLEVLEDDHRRFPGERLAVGETRISRVVAALKDWEERCASELLSQFAIAGGELIRQPKTEWVPFDGVAAVPYMRDPWVDGFWAIEAYDLSAPGVPMRKVYRWVFP